MKIGILTHHYVKNYGAFLQMKAMYETMTRIYPDAEIFIVNYVNVKHWIKNIIHVLHYRGRIDTVKTYSKKVKQLFVFTKFEHSLKRTKRVYDSEQIKNLGLDLIVFGSDEIWNLNGSGYHSLKFGYGFDKYSASLIAYAPSVGSVTDETSIPSEVSCGLHSFDHISARDDETVRFVQRATGVEAPKMLDPTFLYDFNIDIKKSGVIQKPFKYILVYDCKLTDDLAYQLRNFADERGLKILGAGDYKKYYDEVTINLTPYEWVDLFRNAEQVVTGTFHGTVFSIKYDKNLICYPTEKNRINKIKSLLSDMGMEDCLMNVGSEMDFLDLLEKAADYTYAHKYIAEGKEKADIFLQG